MAWVWDNEAGDFSAMLLLITGAGHKAEKEKKRKDIVPVDSFFVQPDHPCALYPCISTILSGSPPSSCPNLDTLFNKQTNKWTTGRFFWIIVAMTTDSGSWISSIIDCRKDLDLEKPPVLEETPISISSRASRAWTRLKSWCFWRHSQRSRPLAVEEAEAEAEAEKVSGGKRGG